MRRHILRVLAWVAAIGFVILVVAVTVLAAFVIFTSGDGLLVAMYALLTVVMWGAAYLLVPDIIRPVHSVEPTGGEG